MSTDPRRERALARLAARARGQQAGERIGIFLDILEGARHPDPVETNRRLHPRMFMPALTARPYWEASRFPLAPLLRARLPLLREEAMRLLAQPSAFDSAPGTAQRGDAPRDGGRLDGSWNAWYLQRQFRREALAASRTPVALRTLDGCAISREALISVVGPGTRVAPHSDELNFVTTLYLPLVATPGAWIAFDGVRREWREGDCFAADSTFYHESSNPTPWWRAILIVDLWHPELSDSETAFLADIMPRIDAVMRGEPGALA